MLDSDGGVDIVAECTNGTEAIEALRRTRPDVAFLDIRMPGADGFQVAARAVDTATTRLVYVTAHAEHALRAFDSAAIDYLLKPLSPVRLRATLQRLRCPVAPALAGEYPERLIAHVGARLHPLEVAGVDAVLAQANYVELYCGTERYLLRDTLTRVESQLDPRSFVRVHRSRIVRIAAVRDLELLESGQYLLRLHSGLRLSSGRQYRERLRQALGLAPR